MKLRLEATLVAAAALCVAAGSAALLAPGTALAEACEVQRLHRQVVLQDHIH